MKFAVIITLKKDVLDPQGKVIQQTLQGIGINTIKNLRQGKYIEIQLNETDESKAHSIVENMCKKLLVNLIMRNTKLKNLMIICYCFSGSNCDRDVATALTKLQFKNKMVWHKDSELPKSDLIVIQVVFLMEIISDLGLLLRNQIF